MSLLYASNAYTVGFVPPQTEIILPIYYGTWDEITTRHVFLPVTDNIIIICVFISVFAFEWRFILNSIVACTYINACQYIILLLLCMRPQTLSKFKSATKTQLWRVRLFGYILAFWIFKKYSKTLSIYIEVH